MKRKWSRANKPDGNGLLRVPDLQAASAQIEGHAGSRPLCIDAPEYAKERSNLAPAHQGRTRGGRTSCLSATDDDAAGLGRDDPACSTLQSRVSAPGRGA